MPHSRALMVMWSKVGPRNLLAVRSRGVQRLPQVLLSRRRLASIPPEQRRPGVLQGNGGFRGQEQHAGGGGDGWRGGNNYRRSWKGFREVVPISWLFVSCISLVDFASSAYVLEAEDFGRLIQRCNFHIAAVTAGDVADLSSLYDLLDWVYESMDAFGPTALPKLLDAGVIDVVLKGTQSPNSNISTLCHEMLNVLSSNEHVAMLMAKNPAVRTAIVGEVTRQLHGWKDVEGPTEIAPDEANDVDIASQKDEHVDSISALPPPPRHPRQGRRLSRIGDFTGGVEEVGNEGYKRPSSYGAVTGQEKDGAVYGEVGEVVAGTVVLDPFYAALTIHTLSNVMKASRAVLGTPESPAEAFKSGVSNRLSGEKRELPWPAHIFYGANNYDGDSGCGEYSEYDVVWSLEQKLVGDIAELVLNIGARGSEEQIDVLPYEGHPKVSEVGQMEVREALQGLEMAAATFLREISSHPQLVGLLMQKRSMFALVTLSWRGLSIKAEDLAAEATMNVCDAYRRLYSVPMPPEKMTSSEVVSILNLWSKKIMAEEQSGDPPVELSDGYEDERFMTQAEQAVPPPRQSDAVLKGAVFAIAGLSGVVWGALRRWVAWRMAGETFSAVSSFALPKALTWAGLRAGTGAAILTSVYGPFGFRSQMRYKTLDASSGQRGTLSMSGVREIADIGSLYAILRLFPYALLPAIVLNPMISGAAYGDMTW